MRTLSTLSLFHNALSGEGESTLSTGSFAGDDGLAISRQADPCCLPAGNQKRYARGSRSTSRTVTWRPKHSPEARGGKRRQGCEIAEEQSTGCTWLPFA